MDCPGSGLVAQHFQAELLSGHLFVFFSRKRTDVIFNRAGMLISRNTLFGMLLNIASLASGLVGLMNSRVVSSDVIGVDDTTVRLQDPSLTRKLRSARLT